MAFVESTLAKLRARNRREVWPFADLVVCHGRAVESAAHLAAEKDQLAFINEKLKEENQALKLSGGSPKNAEAVSSLEKKLFAAQEELTEMHRRRGENAQQIIDQSAMLKAKEEAVSSLRAEVEACRANLDASTKRFDRLQSVVCELQATNQLIKDEYQTLQLALSSAERKLVEAQKGNDQLVAQIIEFKERDVTRLNQENDKAMRLQRERIRQQLEEAALDPKHVVAVPNTRKISAPVGQEALDSAQCHSVRIPTRCFLRFDAHEGEVNAIQWSPHGLTVSTGGSDRKIKVWDISKNVAEQTGQLTGSNGAVMSIDYDSAGTLLLAASSDFASRVWTVDDQRLRHTLTGHSNKVLAAKFMVGDNNKVATASYDRTIKIWDLRSKACIATKFPGSSCNDLVCADNTLISGHFDKKIRFWDVRAGTEPVNEVSLDGKITSLDISRNGMWLLACCRDDTLKLLELRSYDIVRSFSAEGFQVGCDWARAIISPDSAYVSAGSVSGTIYIWNINDGSRLETSLPGEHEAPVISVAWQPAGNSLTTCDKNKKVVVWAAI